MSFFQVFFTTHAHHFYLVDTNTYKSYQSPQSNGRRNRSNTKKVIQLFTLISKSPAKSLSTCLHHNNKLLFLLLRDILLLYSHPLGCITQFTVLYTYIALLSLLPPPTTREQKKRRRTPRRKPNQKTDF